jgi:non-heme chloroperoxidase
MRHSVTFLNGSTNNKLEILDWGGSGKPVLFLAGLGCTAHVFDDFAPKFTDRFHVYGLTRRGFGVSEQTTTGYNPKVMTADILTILDNLHIDKIILIGHSIAGQELSRFAATYADRVEKIIYLDAAYDYTQLDDNQRSNFQQSFPKITRLDSSSADHLNKFYSKILGVLMPLDEIKQTSIFSKDGKFIKDVTPDSISGIIFQNVEHPDYSLLKSPALAIYATHPSIQKFIPFYVDTDSTHKKLLENYYVWFNQFEKTEMDRFKNGVTAGKVEMIPDASHYIFISHPIETEKLIRDFL